MIADISAADFAAIREALAGAEDELDAWREVCQWGIGGDRRVIHPGRIPERLDAVRAAIPALARVEQNTLTPEEARRAIRRIDHDWPKDSDPEMEALVTKLWRIAGDTGEYV